MVLINGSWQIYLVPVILRSNLCMMAFQFDHTLVHATLDNITPLVSSKSEKINRV
jgi:hypothetical protein